jgi:hypothetical protein
MKKLLAILLLATTSLSAQIGGSGTYADPWEISTPGQLDTIRIFLKDSTGYKIFELVNDIDCDGVTWMDGDTLFAGFYKAAADTFQLGGNGYSIKNLDLRWDTTRHSVTGVKVGQYGGFLGQVLQRHANTKDTILHDIVFDNVKMFWDSTVNLNNITALENPKGAIGIGRTVNGSAFWAEVLLYNVKFINCVVRFNGTSINKVYTGIVFGEMGGGAGARSGEFIQVGVDSCSIYSYLNIQFNGHITGIFGGWLNNTNVVITESYSKNSYIYQHANPGRYEFSGGHVGGFIGQGAFSDTHTDCYAYNNIIVSNGTYGGDSDPSFTGGMFGAATGNLNRVYTAGNTYTRLNAAAQLDQNAWFAGQVSGSQTLLDDHYMDTTGMAASDYYGAYGENAWGNLNQVGDTVNMRTTAQMKTEGTYNNWDFDDVWHLDAGINDGYPYLLWEIAPMSLDTPVGGEVYTYPDEIPINWTSQHDTILIYYSIDSGFSWLVCPVDTAITDTVWIPVGISSASMRIRIVDEDSSITATSSNFTYIGVVQLTILEPLNVTGVTNDGTYADSIVVESILADSVNLYYSLDSLNWVLIVEEIPQPDVQDTVFYYWNPIPFISGDIWIKATTEADTSMYGPFDSTLTVLSGGMRPSQPAICWTDGGTSNALRRDFELDVSCGWSQPTIQLWTGYINDDGTAWTHVEVDCSNPCPLPVWSTIGSLYLYTDSDTTETTWTEFYDEVGDTVTYKQREYWIGDSTLYMNDLRNNIDSITIADLSTLFTTTWAGTPSLGVYNVQWSTIVSDTLSVNTNFEDSSDVGFTPRLIISGLAIGGNFSGVSYDLLAAPPSGEYAEDVALAYSAFSYNRYYFRGIHPKIRKN